MKPRKTNSSRAIENSKLDAFVDASVPKPNADHKGGTLAPAQAMLKQFPELPTSSMEAACVAGNSKAIAHFLKHDPRLANRKIGIRKWPALCYLTFSRFFRLDKKRSIEFCRCAKLLLNAGADPNSYWPAPHDPAYPERALYGAAGIANSPAMTKLLLNAGADPNDNESLYHASEFHDNAALKVLLKAKLKRPWISYNLCHKMDIEDPAGVKLFIAHGADVNVLLKGGLFKGYRPLHFAIFRDRSLEVFRILLNAGANPNLKASNGLTPYQLASIRGQESIARLLRSHGANNNLNLKMQFLTSLSRGDAKIAAQLLRSAPGLKKSLTDFDRKLMVDAAERGTLQAVKLMLRYGFPLETRQTTYGGWDATALHWAAWKGHPGIVKLLLKRGADPKLQHGYGGNALGAALHGGSNAGHQNGPAVVKIIATAMPGTDLKPYLEFARTQTNKKIVKVLETLIAGSKRK